MNPSVSPDTSHKARDSANWAPRVAVSILNWNGWQDTLECLESVRRLDYPNYLSVVVDNGSWDDSLAILGKRTYSKSRGPQMIAAKRESTD